jgi:hypothetical protein
MRHRISVLLVSIACVTASVAAARAAELPVLDVQAVPHLKPEGRASYANFLLANVPRAFAVATSGAFGSQSGGTLDQVRSKALASCAAKGGTDCAIYAEDLTVVWPGRPRIDPPAVPGPLVSGSGYAFVPDQRFIWRGPQAARGLFVWGHGKAPSQQDLSQDQPQSYVRAFNNAGFDVVRFARAPVDDGPSNTDGWLHAGLPKLRAMGWRMLVVAGQSVGGWASLQALDTPGLADAVIAISAAYLTTANLGNQAAGLYSVTHAANAPAARVAVVYFQGDPFVTEGVDTRVANMRAGLTGRVGTLLIIDQPKGLSGHGGANTLEFSRRFGPCLLRFVLDSPPPTECSGETP